MKDRPPPVCFHCGQATEAGSEGPRLNRLPDGRTCPACADRLLLSLPSLVREVADELERFEQLEFEGFETGSFGPDEPA